MGRTGGRRGARAAPRSRPRSAAARGLEERRGAACAAKQLEPPKAETATPKPEPGPRLRRSSEGGRKISGGPRDDDPAESAPASSSWWLIAYVPRSSAREPGASSRRATMDPRQSVHFSWAQGYYAASQISRGGARETKAYAAIPHGPARISNPHRDWYRDHEIARGLAHRRRLRGTRNKLQDSRTRHADYSSSLATWPVVRRHRTKPANGSKRARPLLGRHGTRRER